VPKFDLLMSAKLKLIALLLAAVLLVVFQYHHLTCRANVQFCSNLFLQVTRTIGTLPDGRPDQWLGKNTKVALPCPPKFSFSQVVDSYHRANPSSSWRVGGSASRAEPRWLILLTIQSSGSTWIRKKLNIHPQVVSISSQPTHNSKAHGPACR
jgi:hypothetical protein